MEDTINLKKIINKDLMIINSQATDKDTILKELCLLLQEKKYINDYQSFLNDIYLREKEGVTGIGDGIAIPHGKSISVDETTVAIAVLKDEIEWETLDDQDVKVVILFAVKDTDATTTHIVLLQKVATLLARETFIKQLKNIENKEELYDLIINS
ncbi:PTS sugar transporter subunit IIA [Mammaliicoccus lentus]|jgi:PTS system fructose-specific IIA component|uniref:Fructose PTS transporter subunit IIA n=1 Tax=Mammaliicoccus lentus TaxID=42858 RepID=A0AAX3W5X7_MAMLE|nr:fructose PTS transporter subunit IIA [Mammaliicoccus lentus]MBU6113411.1 fructose PTS transporter subunit IIA [Mammaliicoccus lentus]WHI60587.1 fructose PTS transporter subunit IIA [Mammaliicoccus lentus]